MKSIVIAAAALLVTTSAAHAQSQTMPDARLSVSDKTADPTAKPKGQIITLKNPTDRKLANTRAHCSNGTVYWSPKIEEGLYYCEGSDAPAPTPPAQ